MKRALHRLSRLRLTREQVGRLELTAFELGNGSGTGMRAAAALAGASQGHSAWAPAMCSSQPSGVAFSHAMAGIGTSCLGPPASRQEPRLGALPQPAPWDAVPRHSVHTKRTAKSPKKAIELEYLDDEPVAESRREGGRIKREDREEHARGRGGNRGARGQKSSRGSQASARSRKSPNPEEEGQRHSQGVLEGLNRLGGRMRFSGSENRGAEKAGVASAGEVLDALPDIYVSEDDDSMPGLEDVMEDALDELDAGLMAAEDGEEHDMRQPMTPHDLDRMMEAELRRIGEARLRQAELEEAQGVPKELQRSLRVGMIGVPNAGKSVLTNTLVGGKVSAVSKKVNTTQTSTLGIKTDGRVQVLFYDLPGVVVSRDQLHHRSLERVASAWGTAAHCDLLLFVVDAHHQVNNPDPAVWKLAEDLQRVAQLPGLSDWKCPPIVLVLTKVDRIPIAEKPRMLDISARLMDIHPFFDCHYISGSQADGTDDLMEVLTSCAKPRPWEFSRDAKTDRTPAMVALEVTREKVYQRLNQELPYRCSVVHASWKVLKDGSVRIEQEILVSSSQQRGIVVGANGEVVGAIGYTARKELEAMWGVPVHLIINVIVDG